MQAPPIQMQQEFKELRQKVEARQHEMPCESMGRLTEQLGRVMRAFEQFDSGMEVIVSIGMLKAGKSTLVNLLTRSSEASPIGYGRDTTLRPAIVRMAKPGEPARIIIYYPADKTTQLDGEKAMQLVIDQLRGLTPAGAPQNLLRTDVRRLRNELLVEVLCTKPGEENPVLKEEPVMVVVETPYSEESKLLGSHKRMLLDMPGCDSPNAETSRDDLYRKICKECDMALILQSSVAPLNEKAVELLGKLLGERSASTIRIIQNRMEAKPWLRREVLEEEQRKQKINACDVLENLPGNKRIREESVASVNLGMAYAGLFEKEEDLNPGQTGETLFTASGFVELEESLHQALPDSRYAHCRDELGNALQDFRKALQQEQNALKAQIAKLEAQIDDMKIFGKEARERLRPEQLEPHADISINDKATLPDFEQLCFDTCKEDKLNIGAVSGKKINRTLLSCSEKSHKKMLQFLSGGVRLTDLLITKGKTRELWDYAEKELIIKAMDTAIDKLNNTYKEQMKCFAPADLPRYRDTLRSGSLTITIPKEHDEPVHQPLGMQEYKEVSILWFHKNQELTYDKVLDNEGIPFRETKIRPIAQHYLARTKELLRQYLPISLLNDRIKEAMDTACKPFLDKLNHQIRSLEEKREHLRSELSELCEIDTSSRDIITRHMPPTQ